MTITLSEMKFYKSATVTDTAANGGLMGASTYTSGVVQNVFPNVLSSERVSGSTKYRKIHCKVANDTDETLYGSKAWLFGPSAGDDWVFLFEGTYSDTQADITGSERKYGSSLLQTAADAGDTVIVIEVEDASMTGIFQAGDTIYISDKLTPTATTGNEEEKVIDSIDSVSGTQVTMTLTEQLLNSYATGTKVSSVVELGDIECSVSGWTETGTFTYDESNYPVILDNIGTVYQIWTLTFTSASAFTVSGNTVGSVGSGNISTDFAPVNGNFTKPYFTLEFAGWGGTPVAGDTLVFITSPAAPALWECRKVPANCSSITGNNVYLCWSGETL